MLLVHPWLLLPPIPLPRGAGASFGLGRDSGRSVAVRVGGELDVVGVREHEGGEEVAADLLLVLARHDVAERRRRLSALAARRGVGIALPEV